MKKRILALALSLTMIMGMVITSNAGDNTPACWMGQIDDDTYLSSISIPGTHDSGSAHINLSYILQCQKKGIYDQLNCGVRYLDIRAAVDDKEDGELKLIHSVGTCKVKGGLFADTLHFSDVVKDTEKFLQENPTETVIMCVKAENSDDSVSEVQKRMYEVIDENKDLWYTLNEIPTLGDVRGKIVLATRFEDEMGVGENRTGMKFYWEDQGEREIVEIPYNYSRFGDSNGLWVQDKYNYASPDKLNAVVDALENCMADDETFFLNFVSTSGSGKIGHPKKYAKVLNRELLTYEYQSGTCYGIVIFDFVDRSMAEAIYNTNF